MPPLRREIVDFPAVGRVVDFQFLPEEKYCWDCYRYIDARSSTTSPRSPRTRSSR